MCATAAAEELPPLANHRVARGTLARACGPDLDHGGTDLDNDDVTIGKRPKGGRGGMAGAIPPDLGRRALDQW